MLRYFRLLAAIDLLQHYKMNIRMCQTNHHEQNALLRITEQQHQKTWVRNIERTSGPY